MGYGVGRCLNKTNLHTFFGNLRDYELEKKYQLRDLAATGRGRNSEGDGVIKADGGFE